MAVMMMGYSPAACPAQACVQQVDSTERAAEGARPLAHGREQQTGMEDGMGESRAWRA